MKIGFIGGGQIASALAGGFCSSGEVAGEHLLVFDRIPESSKGFSSRFGAAVCKEAVELVSGSDVIFLCVKPNDAASVFSADLQKTLKGKLLVSVAAGLTLDFLAEHAGSECKICRAMPNTGAEIRQSATAICFTENVPAADRGLLNRLFASVGMVFDLPEKQFDAVVGVSGSGPAYACVLIEAMSDGGVKAGLPREIATRLAAMAVQGAAGLVLETGKHPAELREKISSPAGTTIAALQVMEQGGVRFHVSRAVEAAAARSKELSCG